VATSFGLGQPSSGQNIYKNLNAGMYYHGTPFTIAYNCKWDTTTLTNNTMYTLAFKFLQIFWPDDGLPRSKLVATT